MARRNKCVILVTRNDVEYMEEIGAEQYRVLMQAQGKIGKGKNIAQVSQAWLVDGTGAVLDVRQFGNHIVQVPFAQAVGYPPPQPPILTTLTTTSDPDALFEDDLSPSRK